MNPAQKSPIHRFNVGNWEDLVLRSEKPVFVDFLVPERPSFLVLPADLLRLRRDWEGTAEVGYLDVTEELPLALQYPVVDLPTLALFSGGKIVKSFVGPARFRQDFNSLISRQPAALSPLQSMTWVIGKGAREVRK